jgi:hypothetical protein
MAAFPLRPARQLSEYQAGNRLTCPVIAKTRSIKRPKLKGKRSTQVLWAAQIGDTFNADFRFTIGNPAPQLALHDRLEKNLRRRINRAVTQFADAISALPNQRQRHDLRQITGRRQ